MNLRCLFKCLAPMGVGLFAAALWAGDVAISDGQNAEDVLGQTDGGGAGVFTQGTPYSSVALQGFNMPYGVDIDTVSHRLFVADRFSCRVMVYDLDSSNVLVDRTADHVLGQADFYGKLGATAKNRMNYPNGVDFDPVSNRLFVADGLNARVLIFDVASITDGENATNELGQATFTAATLATTVNGLNYVYHAQFDAPNNRLFITDYGNNRVMVYDLASITDGENAVNVLGQVDFTTGSTGLTQSRFSTPQDLAYDSASSRLFVGDLNNRRVMVFDVASITDGENAVNVLGQTNFTANGTAVTQKGLTAPSGLTYDGGAGRLFVSDVSANRIVVYDVASITDGENAVNVLGQTNFTASGAAVSQSGLLNPRGLAFDSGNNRVYNVDYLHCRLLSFDVASITDGENADNVIGQTDGMGGGVYTTQGVYDGAAVAGFDLPAAVEVDTVAHRLFVADYNTHRVLEYDLDASNTLVDRTIDHFLGQLEITRNLPTTTAYSTYGPTSLAFDPATNRLFVANYWSRRVTVFDVASITDGENAVNVLGQTTMTTATQAATQSGMSLPAGISFEPANSRLYVADNVNHRVLVYDVASITDGENAINVLGQTNFTTASSGATQSTMNSPYFVNHDGGSRLFVGDRSNNRVLVFDTTSITDGENAVNVLGQTNFTTATSGTTQAKFQSLYGLASDRTGNRLFVSDFSNSRLLVFDTTVITDGENAVNVLGQSNFTTGTYGTAQNRLYYPIGITYEPGMNRLYVADRYNNRVLTYSAGPVAPSTSTLAASAGVEQVTLSWNSAGDDGVFNNLTGNYRIQYATYTATWSTGSTPTNAVTVTVATTSVAPGSAQSRTIGSLDGGVTYYFVLWTQDESNNWSGISNTTSAVPSAYAWFDTAQIEVDGVNGGLQDGDAIWGDFDNDGDPDILVNGLGSSYQLRVYKNNGNGTFDIAQVEVDGINGGLSNGSVAGGLAAGDFDNDGDLDILISGGTSGSNYQLRVYRGNGNATFDANQIELDGLNGGLTNSGVAWGDYDNDGDLDVLAAGTGGGYQLRVYRNNGNGTFDPNQLDVDGVGYGVYQSRVAWGDYDMDGDLDILAGGYDVKNYQLRVYKNNGNGTISPTQIEVDGSGGGLQQCGVAWGDFDNDGDLDILGVGDNGSKQLRVYKNNGNGTIDAAQIEVDSAGGGLTAASGAWGDFDNDGDLDILENGTDGTNRQLRVYKNNGNISFSPNQIEVDGLNGGLSAGGAAWGDFDNDGDLDVLTSGTDGTNRQLRVYKNQSAVANTAPSAPTTLTAAWAYNASGISTATFKWNPAVDNGSSATPANVLTYQVEISSSSGFTGKSLVADPHGSSPGMGNYLKPPLIFDGLTTHGVMLYSLPLTNTTFYYRVKTIDAGLKESAWSSTGSLYTPVPSSAPSAVADLSAGQLGDGQITLKWTEPLNINSGANAQYDVRFSTTAAIANDMDFTNATSLSGEPTPGIPGNATSMSLLNLTPMVTYYFGLKSSNDNGTSALDVITPRPNAVASPFDATQIEVDGLRGGLYQGGAAWGDFDNDGDMDVLASGYDGSARQLRVYKNNGNGTIDPSQIEVEALNGGFNASMVAWGDFDNDGDLDILVDGDDSTGKQLRIYKNNANGTFNATQIEVESLNGGLIDGGVAWGDFDNDGDLDISLNGYDGSNSQLRVYKNNGNGTVDPTQIEVDGLNGGLRIGTVAWGDFDKDGDLDILTNGSTGSNQLRVYKNQGDGTFDTTQIEVDGLNGGMQAGGSTWGDFDNDGDMDILIAGWDGSNSQLRIYKNKNDGTFDTTQIEVDGVNNGLRYSSVAWGDHDNDGDLDILVSGYDGANNQLRIYRNNANGTIHPTQIEVDGLGGGLRNCSVAWGDYDNDRDLDILVLGYDGYYQLRIYKNQFEAFQTNTLPTAPSSFSSGFSFTSSSVSVASMTWSAGSDSGTGSTPENVLTYDVQISTTSNFGTLMFPGQLGATPRMGSYLKPPKIFNSNTDYGVVLKSTDPWNVHTTASYGLRTDTTYYYRVKTMDSALAESAWSSSTGTLNTGVSPSTSTLAATAGTSQVSLSWNSAGDDGSLGNLTGQYRIQYATYTATWSTSSTPTGATTVTIATTTQSPGSAQGYTATSLTGGLTYYFVLWSGDEVPNWSSISNTTNTIPAVPVTVTLAEAVGQPGWIGQGETQRILGTAQAVSNSASGVTVSSVAVRETGSYTADGNLTNVEVWVSSSGYIDASAIRLENTAKAFSSDAAVFTQNVTVSTTPLYFIARADVSGSATEGTFDLSLQVYTTALTANNPITFTNATDVVAPPSGAPSGLTATPSANLLQVNLSWGSATGADTYSIYRATYSGVTTTDFLLGITNATTFADDYIPPNQQMYYKVLGTNRAGASSASGAANATSVDVSALTTSNIYLRAGIPSGFGDGNAAYRETLLTPYGTFVDHAGNVYIADSANNRVRFVPKASGTYFAVAMKANYVYTIAGTGSASFGGDGGVATSAQVRSPKGVFVDSSGNVFIADTDNNRIRFIAKNSGTYFGISMTANYIYTIAGNGTGTYGGDAGAATSGQVFNPFDVCADANGNVYVADTLNHRVRFIPRTNGTYFGQSMTANYIYTIVGDGTGTYGGDGGSSASAQINRPYGVGVDVGGNVYVTDTYNHRIRFVAKISGTSFGQSMTANYIYTIAGDGSGTYGGNGGVATSAGVRYPSRTALDSLGNLYITDTSNSRLRIVAKTSGTYFGQAMTAHSIYTLAGTGAASFSGDGGPAASASMSSPLGVSVDGGGNIYLVERDNNRIRVIAHANGGLFGISMTANYIYTIVGGGQGSYEGDGKISNAGPLYTPYGVATDTNGNIYLADSNNNRIRFVPKTSGSYFGQSMTANFLYTIAGNGSASYGGDGAVATAGQIRFPNGVTLDSEGNVYITDTNNHRIRFVPKTNGTYFGQSMTANYIYTIAGTGAAGYSGDDALATSKNLYWPGAINLDSNGNLYIADTYDHRIRFVPKTNGSYFGQSMTANFIYTIGGDGTAAFGGDGGAATSAQLNHPKGVAVDTVGNVYVGDYLNNRIRCIAKTSGTYFGISMTANYIYTVAGTGASGSSGDGGAATSCLLKQPTNVAVDAGGNMYIADFGNHRIRFIPKTSGTYFGQSKTANYIYKLGGSATAYNGENAVATGKNIFNPYGVFPGPDHMVYLTDSNNKIRMIAGEDFIAPSTSTLAASAGLDEATISWASAGDDNVNLGNLTGNYRIQYATYTAVWSTSSTPTNATTVTLATTTQSPGSAQGYTATGLTGGLTYYFVLWSGDEIPNWSTISNTTSTIPVIPLRSVTITSGSSQAFGVVMMGSQVVGTTGTVVTNDGNLVNTYALRASTLTVGSPWQIQSSTPTGPDQLVFYGVFDGASAPGLGSFDVDDVIGPVNRDSTSAQFSVAGSTTGVAVPAGQDRTLWIRLDAPTTTTTVADQTLRIEITAQPP